MTIDEIEEQVERLPASDRGALISRLIASLGRPTNDVGDEEVMRRVEELESGEVEDISHEELLLRMKHAP